MSLLIESIRLENGRFHNLRYHEQRMNRALLALFKNASGIDLPALLKTTILPDRGCYKCRVVYDDRSADLAFIPYVRNPVEKLRALADDSIIYPHKFRDRSGLDRLYAMRRECDDILIIRNGQVTDASYANIVFRRNECWFTPRTPLLAGTMREYLIDTGKIQAITIRKEDVYTFETFKLINAMIGFDGPENDVANIVF
ncbi:MAG TPA: aminotransferase class IV [Cyclobacteriaceae bacterium]